MKRYGSCGSIACVYLSVIILFLFIILFFFAAVVVADVDFTVNFDRLVRVLRLFVLFVFYPHYSQQHFMLKILSSLSFFVLLSPYFVFNLHFLTLYFLLLPIAAEECYVANRNDA